MSKCFQKKVLFGKEIYELGASQFNDTYKIFSAQLSTRVKANHLKRYIKDGARNDEKYYYGLPEFFNGDKIKEEYKP